LAAQNTFSLKKNDFIDGMECSEWMDGMKKMNEVK